MTTTEFNNEFDILYNNIASDTAPGLDTYEKSVFLTKAQEEIVLSLYGGRGGMDSFENTEELRRYLESIVEQATISTIKEGYYRPEGGEYDFYSLPSGGIKLNLFKGQYCRDLISSNIYLCTNRIENPDTHIITKEFEKVSTKGINYNRYLYTLPDNLWFIVYEYVLLEDGTESGCTSSKVMDVLPVTHDEYSRVKKNPFRGATDSRVLRLDAGKSLVELVSSYPSEYTLEYTIRYVRKVAPIIIEDLDDPTSETPTGLRIDGQYKQSECELHPALHRIILDRAVKLAITAMAQSVQQ